MELTAKAEIVVEEPCRCEFMDGCECHLDRIVHPVLVHGSVWEVEDSAEVGVHVGEVENLPAHLDRRFMDDLQIEACALALQFEYEGRLLRQKKLPGELKRIADSLRRTLSGPSESPSERVGALTFALQVAKGELEQLASDLHQREATS